MKNPKKVAYLFGPFVGELSWELYRFAPYAIYNKKDNPDAVHIVLTRPSRFDLYGKYADILIPLKGRDKTEVQDCFTVHGIDLSSYDMMKDVFFKTYKDKYFVLKHFFPDIAWRYNVKWQFPRNRMDYNFLPRNTNKDIINELIGEIDSFILIDKFEEDKLSSINYNYFTLQQISNHVSEKKSKKFSFIGCLIEVVKRSSFVIGDIDSSVSRLALLLKKPVISINETMSDDAIGLLNPFDTSVIKCRSLEEGINIYEDNF